MIRLTILLVLTVLPIPAVADTPPDDPFAAGTRWQGTRFKDQKWWMTITHHDLKTLKLEGRITIERPDGKNDTYTIKGTANNKTLHFDTVKKGKFDQSFEGRIEGGEITFEFKGTSVSGDYVTGKARLKPMTSKKK